MILFFVLGLIVMWNTTTIFAVIKTNKQNKELRARAEELEKEAKEISKKQELILLLNGSPWHVEPNPKVAENVYVPPAIQETTKVEVKTPKQKAKEEYISYLEYARDTFAIEGEKKILSQMIKRLK
jgi:hypothetical protein